MKVCLTLLGLLSLIVMVGFAAKGPKGERVLGHPTLVFFGDSITAEFDGEQNYVSYLRTVLKKRYPNISVVNAGVPGDTVINLVSRVEADVSALHPDAVVIYIGINDVWRLPDGFGTPQDRYVADLQGLVQKLTAEGARVALCTPSVIGERADGGNPLDADLDRYAELVRSIAQEHDLPLCDLRTSFLEYLGEHNPGNAESQILTVDGVHLTERGNRLVSDTLMPLVEKILPHESESS